ncbi:MAG: dTMP kinase [Deltaproteobacteria bacterium]|nr:dTMP kinase [Deltaproteobacteria bacterium]
MFITFEGIEGSGKSTQIARLVPVLRKKGFACVVTREPGATRIGKKIRHILLDSGHDVMVATTELLLYQADRAQHIHEVIEPALKADKVVISDRFSDATTVYQGYARGLDLNWIERLNDMVVGGLKPDLTLILDLPVELGLRRAWERIENQAGALREDRFEKETLAFHEKVRQGYLALAGLEPERFRIIDASGDPDPIHENIVEVVTRVLHTEQS